MAFVSLAIIALVAFASPFIASAIPGKPVPETVFLLVFGAVLGPHMLGVIHVDAEVSLVSELGLAFLFLLAGFEIDPKSITGVEGRYGLATWVVTFGIAWLAVRFTPWFSVSHFDGIAVTLALTSTALGTLVPIMRERSLTGTRVGDSILAYGTWGELGPVLAMSVLLSARTGIQTLVILGLFAVVCVLLAVVPSRSKRVGSRFFAFVEERADTTSQTFVRLTVLILVTLVAFSAIFDLDIVLGSFAAGFVLRYIIPEGNHTLETKLDGLAYGFLIPVFFTVSGAKIDLTAVASRPGLLVGFIMALLIIRAVPHSCLYEHLSRDARCLGVWPHYRGPVLHHGASDHRCRDQRGRQRRSAFEDIASIMVAAGAITVFLMPLLAQLFYRVVDAAPVAAVAEVAEHPSDAFDILRAHHDLASLLAREHELLTSHGHGRTLDGIPTLDSIADSLSAEAASGHIDARIVDAAHLLAEKTYGDEIDPSKLTRASAVALSAPSSPCTNTAAACWSSTHEKKPRTTTASSRYRR